jgi:hypothetical protein
MAEIQHWLCHGLKYRPLRDAAQLGLTPNAY